MTALVAVGLGGVAFSAPREGDAGYFDAHASVSDADQLRDGALSHHGHGDRDGRKGRQGPSAKQQQLAAQANLRVDWNQFGTPLQVISANGGALAKGLSSDPERAARAYLAANQDLFGLNSDAVSSLQLVSVSPIGDGHAVELRQTFGGVPAGNDGTVRVGVTNGTVYYVSSSLARKAPRPQAMTLSEIDAIKAAAADVGMNLGTLKALGLSNGRNRYSATGADGTQSALAVAVPMPDGTVRAAYEIGLNDNGDETEAYTSFVDGRTGEVLVVQDNVQEETDNPQWKAFGANPPADYSSTDTRQLWCWTATSGCDIAVGNPSSPLGWDVDPSLNAPNPSFTSRGNNEQAARTWTGSFSLNNVATSSPTRDYTPAWTNQWHDSSCNPNSYTTGNRNDIDAAIYNLAVMHNRMHDFSYKLGFTEVNRNMQVSNFGLGGAQNDPERANAQSGAQSNTRNNANQSTPNDGSPGSTNMYLWQAQPGSFYPPCVDGDYDMSVIGHEYTHGISNRMVNGGLSGTHAGSMGESWSDLVATEYLHEYNLVPADQTLTVVGQYVTGSDKRGIRDYDIAKSPLNYSNFGFDLVGPEVHADGEVWNAIQWEVRQAFINKYGAGTVSLNKSCADGLTPLADCPGSRRWIQTMFDAWLLMPRAVTMPGARDAMLAADLTRTGGANTELMQDAFARRGLGVGAAATSGSDTTPKASFTTATAGHNATVTFVAGGQAQANATNMQVFIGDYQARSRAAVTVDPNVAGSNIAQIAAGTYNLFVKAPGYGLTRSTMTVTAGQATTVVIDLQRNLAAAVNGATASGDGVNAAYLIDEDEGTQWAYLGAKSEDPAGKGITVKLAGNGPQTVRKVNVSALLRPAKTGDPGGDNLAQNRFTALRSFQVLACTAVGTVDCSKDSDFRVAYTSADDAFPAERPRPVTPVLNLRSFNIPATVATHLRINVLSSQCSGNPIYAGQQSNDTNAANQSDCKANYALSGQVRIAEFEAFNTEGPALGGQVITADVSGSPLSMAVSGSMVTMPATTLTGYDQVVSGALNKTTVRDPRGTSAGWNLTGQVSDFVGPNGTIPAANLGWQPTAVTITGSLPVGPGAVSAAIPGAEAVPGAGLADAKVLCLANSGSSAGAFECGATLKLGIPGSTRLGTYTGVLTLTLV